MNLSGNHSIAPIKDNNSSGKTTTAPETFQIRHHPRLKDSILVQTSSSHNYVNDCEAHEEHPHLEDFLKPHHTIHFEQQTKKYSLSSAASSQPGQNKENETNNEYLSKIPCYHKTVHIPLHTIKTAAGEDIGSKLKEDNAEILTLQRPCTRRLHHKDSASREPCKKTEARRTIRFKDVILREYGMILGDHPNCRFGLPVTIEWDYVEYEPLSVDEYEIHHALRRPLRKMILPSAKRKDMFCSLGYKKKDLNEASKQLYTIKTQRWWTQTTLPFRHIEAGIESLLRKLKRKVLCSHT